jgi:hypothetical protein
LLEGFLPADFFAFSGAFFVVGFVDTDFFLVVGFFTCFPDVFMTDLIFPFCYFLRSSLRASLHAKPFLPSSEMLLLES